MVGEVYSSEMFAARISVDDPDNPEGEAHVYGAFGIYWDGLKAYYEWKGAVMSSYLMDLLVPL